MKGTNKNSGLLKRAAVVAVSSPILALLPFYMLSKSPDLMPNLRASLIIGGLGGLSSLEVLVLFYLVKKKLIFERGWPNLAIVGGFVGALTPQFFVFQFFASGYFRQISVSDLLDFSRFFENLFTIIFLSLFSPALIFSIYGLVAGAFFGFLLEQALRFDP